MKLFCNNANPPLGGWLAVQHYKSSGKSIEVSWGSESSVILPGSAKAIQYGNSNDLIRILENAFNKSATPLQKLTLNHWLTFCLILEDEMPKSVEYLDKTLGPLTYLIGESLTAADLSVFAILYASGRFRESKPPSNVSRWYRLIEAQPAVAKALKELPKDAVETLNKASARKSPQADSAGGRQQEGKFVDLPHAEMGKVVVRFPPEASGYLHIGHAKAALLNQYYQQAFEGKLIMRFDDTNPAKENAEFEKVILEDVEMLEIKPDLFTHTSQYFDLMLGFCEKLIKEGKAFVDDTPAEQMKAEREQKIDSKNKKNSVKRNLELWEEMKRGSAVGVTCCVRAIIDMQSTNGCLRDPTIYRCKPEEHPRTGTQYKVYPTYDFACPIVDSIEGVTHVLRTMEYHDRDPQFYWFIEALGLRKPYIWEYSRLSMTNTVLSKRKLTWFVEQGLVDGWDDPRMPTVRGVLRRGLRVEALRQFIRAQGSSRSVVFMEWDKIWAINKKVIDPVAPRYTALETNPVPVNLKGVTSESTLTVALHPKNPEVGNKNVLVAPRLLIDQVDAKTMKEGENTTFINYGNVLIDKIHRSADGTVTSIDATPNLDNKDYKKTLKITWLAESASAPTVETYCVYFDNIISKPVLGKDEDFKQYIGHETRWEIPMLGEPSLASLRKDSVIQLQRRGFFRVDVSAAPPSPYSGKARPLVLFHIPDGHTKEMPGQPKPAAAVSVKQSAPAPAAAAPSAPADALNLQISQQGDLVRSLKSSKAEKGKIDEAVKLLLELKAKYKAATGQDWKPGSAPASSPPAAASSAPADAINLQITQQGDLVRSLKSSKAEKSKIDEAVKLLLELKAKYKAATGQDWKPGATPAPAAVSTPASSSESKVASVLSSIAAQGDKVRKLKSEKADKVAVDAEVKTLLNLKAEYKTLTGTDWTPNAKAPQVTQSAAPASKPAAPPSQSAVSSAGQSGFSAAALQLNAKITEQGNKVRTLKEQKADKATVQAEVQTLLALKADFKKEAGKDWSPNLIQDQQPASTMNGGGDAASLAAEVTQQGDLVRDLKAKKADKATIDAAVKKLLELKANYKAQTGSDYTPPTQQRETKPKESKPKETKPKENKPKETKPKESKAKEQSPAAGKEAPSSGVKKITRLGLEASKDTDLSEWYSQVLTKAELIDYYDISGCYILRPWSFSIWDALRTHMSRQFREWGVQDCYFPIFVSKAALEREKEHIADFAPEVAWVTQSGSSPLAEHIAVRPTSETVMYPAYSKWIQSHRDLPLKLNQWNNVVRWEFKQPQPFIRSREFLWQEGHTAYLNKEDADKEVLEVLELYRSVYEDLLAVPVVPGRKTQKEKFAGADYTTTVEAYVVASGRGVQAATSHHLGQNFSKMFDIIYDDPETQEKKYVYQNSWGFTTRSIGVMILVHGDDRGLVLPPRVAELQVVVVPCGVTANSTPEDRASLTDNCQRLAKELKDKGIRAHADVRDNYSPGWKFNHWELKGVPIRVELGPKDIAKSEFVAVRRLTGEKISYKRDEAFTKLSQLLEQTHKEMFDKALSERESHTSQVTKWEDFTAALEKKHILLAPFCGEIPCEDNIKTDSAKNEESASGGPAMGAKSLCIPFKPPRQLTDADRCIHPACNKKPKHITLFGRSY